MTAEPPPTCNPRTTGRLTMQRADMSAYPQDENGHSQNGMTIRERFVMAAMQGLLANSDPTVWMNDGGLLSSAAISIADATLAALEQSDG